jgi:hypothetical protein
MRPSIHIRSVNDLGQHRMMATQVSKVASFFNETYAIIGMKDLS